MIQEWSKSAQEVRLRPRKSLRALDKVVDVVNTKQAKSCVGGSIVLVPVLLANIVGQAEFLPLIGHRGVLGQDDVARDADDSLGHTG